MLDLKRVRPLDAAIAVIAVVVLALGAYLGYSVWSSRQSVVSSAPATRAINELSAKVRGNPNDIDARMSLAQALTVAGRDKEAVKQYQAVLSVNKEFVPALSGLGFIALKQKDYPTGEDYFRRVIELLEGKAPVGGESTLETAYFYLGSALLEQKEYEEAASNFKEALRYRRDASDTHYALAVCLRELGLEDAYKESLGNALLFDPKMPEANYDLGQIQLKEGDIAGAAEHFRASADAAPNNELPREALEKLGPLGKHMTAARTLSSSDLRKAIGEARIAVAVDPDSVDAALLLGKLYEDYGNETKAETFYRRVLSLDPKHTEAKAGLKRVTDGS